MTGLTTMRWSGGLRRDSATSSRWWTGGGTPGHREVARSDNYHAVFRPAWGHGRNVVQAGSITAARSIVTQLHPPGRFASYPSPVLAPPSWTSSRQSTDRPSSLRQRQSWCY